MNLLYDYNPESPEDICMRLARDLKRRRLERGLSRSALSMMSGVPAPSIARFETKNAISLLSLAAIAKALGYSEKLKELFDKPVYSTMEELLTINRNANRKRGRNEFLKRSK